MLEALSKLGLGVIGIIVATQCRHSDVTVNSSNGSGETASQACSTQASAGALCVWSFDASLLLALQGLCYLLFDVAVRVLLRYKQRFVCECVVMMWDCGDV
jgi:hypothetical protein